MAEQTLGQYDMVLGLSEDKINHHFKLMYTRKIKTKIEGEDKYEYKTAIDHKWHFLTSSSKKIIKKNTTKENTPKEKTPKEKTPKEKTPKRLVQDEVTTYWENHTKLTEGIKKIDDSLKELELKIRDDIMNGRFDELKLLYKKVDRYNEAIEKMKKDLKEKFIYDMSFRVNIEAPKIEILENEPYSLLFKIKFKKDSKASVLNDITKKLDTLTFDDKTTYAFSVKIGSLKRKAEDIDKATQKRLKDARIHDNEFTIESLFLDFENTNIILFDKDKSHVNEDAIMLEMLFARYFKSIENTTNPYLLGYAVSKKVVTDGDKPMFYPTGVKYSTSFSKEKGASSFNFLMMLDHHKLPRKSTGGTLDSLLEHKQDKSATVNGVFGITIDSFTENYINNLSDTLKDKIINNLGGKAYHSNDKIALSWKDVKGSLDLKYKGIRKGSNKEPVITYKIAIDVTVDYEADVYIEQDTYIDGKARLDMGTAATYWNCSTSGTKHQKGREGTLEIRLKVGDLGKINLSPSYTSFIIGANHEKPYYRHHKDKLALDVAANISSIFGNLGSFIHFDHLFSVDSFSTLSKSVDIQSLANLENKVILPVASVYTYKNIRLDESKGIILFDTSYSPVSSSEI